VRRRRATSLVLQLFLLPSYLILDCTSIALHLARTIDQPSGRAANSIGEEVPSQIRSFVSTPALASRLQQTASTLSDVLTVEDVEQRLGNEVVRGRFRITLGALAQGLSLLFLPFTAPTRYAADQYPKCSASVDCRDGTIRDGARSHGGKQLELFCLCKQLTRLCFRQLNKPLAVYSKTDPQTPEANKSACGLSIPDQSKTC
jgi:hypothetical protein